MKPEKDKYFTPEDCFLLRQLGFPQGTSIWLWHQEKRKNNKWIMYKRNNYDISSFGDKYGYNRWITAVHIDNTIAQQILNEYELDLLIDTL